MDKRQMRVTWNKNYWEKPCGHSWAKENQGNKNIPYENQFGFGHEEWFFNSRYRLNGFQYGYIRGVEKAKLENDIIDELYIYTKDTSNNYFFVGILKKVIRLKNDEQKDIINKLFRKHTETAINELKEVDGEIKELKNTGVNPTLKFKWEDANILEEPIPITIDDTKYKRYQPYKLTSELELFVKNKSEILPKLIFKEGRTNSKNSYTLSKSKGSREVKKLHVEILEKLYDYLLISTSKEKISLEKSTVNGKIIDILENTDANKYNFYEAKTSNSALTNIREAVGQILEYALIDDTIIANKLVIVGPAKLKKLEENYLKRLQNNIKIELEYWYFNSEDSTFNITKPVYNTR